MCVCVCVCVCVQHRIVTNFDVSQDCEKLCRVYCVDLCCTRNRIRYVVVN